MCQCRGHLAKCTDLECSIYHWYEKTPCYNVTFPKEITALDFSGSWRLVVDDSFFANVPHITYLHFSKALAINVNSFQVLTNLTTLIYSYFELSLLSPLNMLENLEITVLHYYTNTYRYRSSCNTTEDFLPRLQRLLLEYPLDNCTLSMFSHHKHLKELSLNWTNIQPTTHAPLSVEVLSLKRNGIKQFPATCYNGTSSLFPELQSLDLSENFIDGIINEVCLPKLQYLSLRENEILMFKATNSILSLYHLISIDLGGNKMTVIENGTFVGFTQLNSLILEKQQYLCPLSWHLYRPIPA
jgi:hypothetical protein